MYHIELIERENCEVNIGKLTALTKNEPLG